MTDNSTNSSNSFVERIVYQTSIGTFASIIFLFCYGSELFNFSLSIDEELATFSGHNYSVWVSQGRWAMGGLNAILPSSVPAMPFISTALFGIGLIYFAVKMTSVFKLSQTSGKFFAGILISSPVWPHIAEFNTLAHGVGIGLILTALSLNQFHYRKPLNILGATILAGVAIGIYQAFLPMLLCGALLEMWNNESENNKRISIYKSVFYVSILAVGSFSIYKCADVLIRNAEGLKSTYVDGYIHLNSIPSSVSKIFSEIFKILSGRSEIYIQCGLTSMLVVWVGYATTLYEDFKRGIFRTLQRQLWLLASCFCAFGLLIASAGSIPTRALIGVPLLFAAVSAQIRWTRTFHSWCLAIPLIAIFSNTYITNALFFADKLARDRDRVLGSEILYRLHEVAKPTNSGPVKLLIIGEWRHESAGPFRRIEIFGDSFFEHDGGNPYRIAQYLRILGQQQLQPISLKERPEWIPDLEKLPDWPRPGSVSFRDETIILKLSPLSYAQKILVGINPN